MFKLANLFRRHHPGCFKKWSLLRGRLLRGILVCVKMRNDAQKVVTPLRFVSTPRVASDRFYIHVKINWQLPALAQQ